MPKKITLSLTLIMLFLGLIPLDVSAATRNGKQYWTVEELIELSREKTLEELYENDTPENMVTEMFNDFRIIVSRINPEKESVSVLYHNVDTTMQRFGEAEEEPLDEFHLVWLEPYFPDPRTDFTIGNRPDFVNQIHSGVLGEETHFLMTRSIVNDGPDWITPNIEVDFDTYENELSSNYTGTLFYAGRIGRWETFNAFEYGSCLENPAYEPGMDCHYVFYQDGTRDYLPSTVIENDRKPQEPEQPQGLEVSAEPTEPISVQEAPTAESTPVSESKISTSALRVPERPSATEKGTSSLDDKVEVPLASKTSKMEKKAPGFPWWLVVFILCGIVIVFWWLVPAKKVKKTLDKS